jgi:Flp pilus assembly protein TadG
MTNRRATRQKGFVLLTMTVSAVALLGALGLAIDMGHMFIVRNETQAFCDSAAVLAASYLNNSSASIQTADTAAKATAIKWNFSTTTISSPTVEYGKTGSGPWSLATAFVTVNSGCTAVNSAQNDPACGFKYARVKTSVQVPLYFLPVVQVTKTYTQTVNSQAIAAQIDISGGTPVSPYTGVGIDSNASDNFGLSIGNDTTPCINGKNNGNGAAVGCYDIQWPAYNNKKFVSPPCASDVSAQTNAVENYWGSSINGYWGASSSSDIAAEVIDYVPNPAWPIVNTGDNLNSVLSSGNKASQATYLDERVNQDGDNYDTTYTAYVANPLHNGRRLLISPIVIPTSTTTTTVYGFGLYFLLSTAASGGQSDYYKGKLVNGNDPFCAMYVGPACVGCKSNGVGGATGSAVVKLVQ